MVPVSAELEVAAFGMEMRRRGSSWTPAKSISKVMNAVHRRRRSGPVVNGAKAARACARKEGA